jgi:hypothetical protein
MKPTASVAIAAAIILLLAGPVRAQNAETEKTLVANERAINAAVVKGDAAAFKQHVAADGWSIDPMGGRTSVAEFLKGFDAMAKDMKISSWDITDTRVVWASPTAAVLTYKWTGSGTYQGQPIPSPVWASTLWINKSGKWQAVYHQETLALPAKK